MLSESFCQARADLGTALFSLSTLAHDLRAPQETVRTLNELGTSLREPFLFVVVGEVKAGKSSLLNALFGREFAKFGVLPTTDKGCIFRYGPDEKQGDVSPRLVELYLPISVLRDCNGVDTPGTKTIVTDHHTIPAKFQHLDDRARTGV